MAKKFNNKRHKELKRKFTGSKSLMNFLEELGGKEIKQSGRTPEDFSRGLILSIGKDSYNQKIEKYVQGFENGEYTKTDLPYAQRIAHNISSMDYELSRKK